MQHLLLPGGAVVVTLKAPAKVMSGTTVGPNRQSTRQADITFAGRFKRPWSVSHPDSQQPLGRNRREAGRIAPGRQPGQAECDEHDQGIHDPRHKRVLHLRETSKPVEAQALHYAGRAPITTTGHR